MCYNIMYNYCAKPNTTFNFNILRNILKVKKLIKYNIIK